VKLDIAPLHRREGSAAYARPILEGHLTTCPRSSRPQSWTRLRDVAWTDGAHPSARDRLDDQWREVLWDLDLLTADDVCTLLKVKRNWLYDTVESGAIEAIRLGKQLRLRPSVIASYLIEHAQAEKRT
jgi:excisionase family DNA binding protein